MNSRYFSNSFEKILYPHKDQAERIQLCPINAENPICITGCDLVRNRSKYLKYQNEVINQTGEINISGITKRKERIIRVDSILSARQNANCSYVERFRNFLLFDPKALI